TDLASNQLVFVHDHFVGDRVDDVRPADATADRVDQVYFHLFAAVDDALGNALGRTAVFHRDDDVLSDVRQLTGEVSGVGRLQSRISQALTGAVSTGEVLE